MAIIVNKKGKSHAMALVNSGNVDRGDAWSFSAEDGNALLGKNGDNWGEYAKWFLAEDTGAAEQTKDRYKYPFGKSGKVYRNGVIAAKQRAAAQGETDIDAAADAVLQKIDKKKEATKMSELSMNDKWDLIEDALYPDNGNGAIPTGWLQDMYDDRVIVNESGDLYEIPYTIDANNVVTLGDRKAVRVTYEAMAELKDIEIFEAGTYRGKTYTEADLDTMVKNFNEFKAEIKPVAVIGHDENQDLLKQSGLFSAGWMESLKKIGSKLVASFKDVPKVLADLIGKGAFKRISSEVYNDYNGKGLALRRVAILGGDIPEVKTLQDIAALYAEKPKGESTWINLSEKDQKSAAPPAPAKAAGDGINVPPDGGKETNMDVTELSEQVTKLTEMMTQMQEEAKAKDAKIIELQTASTAAVTRLSEVEKNKKRDDIKLYLKDRVKDGQISPALVTLGLERFMEGLDDASVMKFNDKTGDQTPLAFMKKFLNAIPKWSVVRFGEIGNPDQTKGKEEKIVDRTQLAEMTPKDQAAFFKAGGKVID